MNTATPDNYRTGQARPADYLGTGRNRSWWLPLPPKAGATA